MLCNADHRVQLTRGVQTPRGEDKFAGSADPPTRWKDIFRPVSGDRSGALCGAIPRAVTSLRAARRARLSHVTRFQLAPPLGWCTWAVCAPAEFWPMSTIRYQLVCVRHHRSSICIESRIRGDRGARCSIPQKRAGTGAPDHPHTHWLWPLYGRCGRLASQRRRCMLNFRESFRDSFSLLASPPIC